MYRNFEFLKALIETDSSVSMPGCHCGLNKAERKVTPKQIFEKTSEFFPQLKMSKETYVPALLKFAYIKHRKQYLISFFDVF